MPVATPQIGSMTRSIASVLSLMLMIAARVVLRTVSTTTITCSEASFADTPASGGCLPGFLAVPHPGSKGASTPMCEHSATA
jgi:hypothetical protein